MQLLNNYQLSEVTIGSILFIFIYGIGSYVMNGEMNIRDIITTVILFGFWYFLVKVTTNYFVFDQLNS